MTDAETRAGGPPVTGAPDGGARALVVVPPVAAPGPDVGDDPMRYERWLAAEDARRRVPAGEAGDLLVALVTVVRQPDATLLQRLARSLVEQSHRRWVLVAAGVGDGADVVRQVAALRPRAARRRLLVVPNGPAVSDGEAGWSGLAAARAAGAGAVMVVGQHDVLAPGALAALVGPMAAGADVVYGDEDTVSGTGAHHHPRLKPDWSPELLLSTDYVGRPALVSAAVLGAVTAGGAAAGSAWEYDLLLRATDHPRRVHHVAGVLVHRGMGPAVPPGSGETLDECPGARDARQAVVAALDRRHEPGHVDPGPTPGTHRVQRRVARHPLVSVVIPFRDGAPLLRRCVESVLRTTDAGVVDILLVDNASREPETAAVVGVLSKTPGVRVVEDPRPFNWAAINNSAAQQVAGDLLLFLNDDVEARHPGWLTAMVAHAVRREVGAVGARLVYPGGELQHAGVVIGLGGAAGHVLRGLPGDRSGYLDQAVVARDVSAVTGACLLTRRSCFDEVGGFDEAFALDLNDIDYCLRLRAAGYTTVVTPLAELVHDESPTRGSSGNIDSILAFLERWETQLRTGDPYLNRNLTRLDGSCALRDADEERRWDQWRASVTALQTT